MNTAVESQTWIDDLKAIFRIVTAILLAVLVETSNSQALAEDVNVQANRLFVEAVQAYKRAEAAPEDRKYDHLAAIKARLERIVADYPGSDLAVQLLTVNKIGPIDQKRLDQDLEQFAPAAIAARRAAHAAREEKLALEKQNRFKSISSLLESLEARGVSLDLKYNHFATTVIDMSFYVYDFEGGGDRADFKFIIAPEKRYRLYDRQSFIAKDTVTAGTGSFTGESRIILNGIEGGRNLILFPRLGRQGALLKWERSAANVPTVSIDAIPKPFPKNMRNAVLFLNRSNQISDALPEEFKVRWRIIKSRTAGGDWGTPNWKGW